MTVLQVADPLAPVGPDAAGGAEQTLAAIDAALVRAGHRSVVIALAASRVSGTLVPLAAARPPFTPDVQRRIWAETRRLIDRVIAEERVHLVHLHGVDCWHYLPDADVPTLVTLHLPIDAHVLPLRLIGARAFLQPVSADVHRRCGAVPGLLPPIPHGVDVTRLVPRTKQEFFLALGRVCPEKGYHLALEAAKALDVSFVLAGHASPERSHLEYFATEVQPRLDVRRRHIGPVGFERKAQLLGAARALVVPSLVPEPTSRVAMEALACGTPVIGFRHGVLPEIVQHGHTGFLVETVEELLEAMRVVDRLSPAACRQAACRRFTVERMTSEYLRRYELLAGNDRQAVSWTHAHAAD